MIKQKIGRLFLRLAMHMGALPAVSPELMARAAAVIAEIESTCRGTNGEFKRHQAYARLRKTFPDAGKPAVALAIEIAKCSI